MSGLVADARAAPAPPTFWRVLWAVLLGYVGASLSLGFLALALDALGLLPRPFLRPGPFPVSGAWSLDADLAAALAVILVAAWWIRRMVADAAETSVSFGVVALVVAAIGFAPYLALRPVELTGLVALPLTTWLVRRYALDRTLPLPHPSWRFWAALAVVGFLVFSSYRLFHPLNTFGVGLGGGTGGSFRTLELRNSGFADLTIVRVTGGGVLWRDSSWGPARVPHVVRAHSSTELFVRGSICRARTVAITYSVLGRAATQQFPVAPDSGCR